MLSGAPGIGKSASAIALANELGCADEYSGRHILIGSEMTIDACRQLFEQTLQFRPMFGDGWRVVIFEELERLPSKQCEPYLKVMLDPCRLPPKTTFIATSNDPTGLPVALLDRFHHLVYESGPALKHAAQQWFGLVWKKLFGDAPMPVEWLHWGKNDAGFSLRSAMREFEMCVEEMQGAAIA